MKLRQDVTGYSVFDLSERLRTRGWQVPAYTFPADLTDTAVMRIVIRNGFSVDLADLLLDDMRTQLRMLRIARNLSHRPRFKSVRPSPHDLWETFGMLRQRKRSHARKDNRSRVTASLRNLAIAILKLAWPHQP